MAERASEVTELKRNLAQALRDKEQLQEVKHIETFNKHQLFRDSCFYEYVSRSV